MQIPNSLVPILMYHKVGSPVTGPRDIFLNVSTEGFRRQMRSLARLGFQARPFRDVVAAVVCGHALPPRTFAITFDDGFACIGETAAPILAEFGFPATVFVVSEGVGKINLWDHTTRSPHLPLMDWDALRRLTAAGWEMGGHTRSHPHLDSLTDAAAFREIRCGKEETEARLGTELQTFCYPFGHFNARTPALVRAAGYRGACTVRSGLVQGGQDPYLLSRIKVAYKDGVTGLLYRLLIRPYLPDVRPFRRSHRLRLRSGLPDITG